MGMSKALARDAFEGVFGTIGEVLAKGNDLRVVGFGTCGTRNRLARTGCNPRNGKTVEIEPSTPPAFKPGKPLKDAANAGGAS